MVTFTPPDDYPGALARARRDLQAYLEARGDHPRVKWGEWAGDSLQSMLLEPEVTAESLRSPVASLRLTAMSLVAEYWPGTRRFAAEVVRLAFDDPEPLVRGAAVMALRLLGHVITDPSGSLRRLVIELFPGPPQEVAVVQMELLRASWARQDKARWEMWKDLVRQYAPDLAANPASAGSYLDHHDARVRSAALFALADDWRSDEERLPELCKRLVLSDPDAKVRALALARLGRSYAQTDDHRIGAFAARFVRDSTSPLDLRRAAYCALCVIRGMPLDMRMEIILPTFHFPEDVNWEFVDSFLDGEKDRGTDHKGQKPLDGP